MFETPRMVVRYPRKADYAGFRRLAGDSELKRFTGPASDLSEGDYQSSISIRSLSLLAVCAKSDGGFIGSCGFRGSGTRIDLELFLLPEAQKIGGLGGELFDAMIVHCGVAFPRLQITASVSPENIRAVRLLDRREFRATDENLELKSGVTHVVYIKKG
jgi:RimJ/RimL family protein N-acetyltransferase